MDREQILEHLSEAERHVAHGEELLAKQRAQINEMRSQGQDVRKACDLLSECERSYKQQVADRDRLRELLAASRTPDPPGD